MADFNVLFMSGRLTKDAEIRATKSGKKLTSFSLAVGDDYNNGKEWIPRAYFFDVVYIGEKDIHKGTKVYVSGKMTQQKVEKEDKATKIYYKIVANKIDFVEPKVDNSKYVAEETKEEVAEDIPF